MSASAYLQFLQSPNTGALADNAEIHYITTTTTIREPVAILKHLGAQAKQVIKKNEQVVGTIQGENGVCLETVTTLQFRESGGAYLPGIDANLLDEKEVVFPLTHVVNFNADGKILQVRLYWDQGTLLKQVEAIGKTGRNWPIRDGKAQSDAVANSTKASGQTVSNGSGAASSKTAQQDLPIREHTSKRDSVSVTGDPHASLSLFAPRDPNENTNPTYEGPRHAVRASAKPAPRDMSELFVGDQEPEVPGTAIRSRSPTKDEGVVLKSGAGKHFSGIRLFDDEPEDVLRSPERKKTYDQKYQHFAFGDGEDAPTGARPPHRKPGQGHQATFSFEDFSTPPKAVEKNRPDYERHWGPGVDADDPGSPPKRPVVHSARPDSQPQFELLDESPAGASKPKSFAQQSLQRQRGAGLYQDPIHDDETTRNATPAKNTGIGVNSNRRGDDFGPHYTMSDSPTTNAAAAAADPAAARAAKRATRSDMQSQWSFESPAERKIYTTAGDGMGSRKGTRAWGIGDDSDPEVDTAAEARARGRGGRRPQPPDVDF